LKSEILSFAGMTPAIHRPERRSSMKKFNKATAAAIAGAIGTIVASVADIDAEAIAGGVAVLTTLLVWLVPNAAGDA
tara:strand:+ start:9418 stop:9648 length:231 start_codon:yes stop_codon:yes gene_type:complete